MSHFRAFIVTLGILALGLSAGRSPAADQSRPNIILILADDLGVGDLGCYGQTRYATPRLDQLAREGVSLSQFNTPAPFCAPTRASLLTGRYPARCGMRTNPTPDGQPMADRLHLPESEILLPQLLRQSGYATAMLGKWHLGHRQVEWQPLARGFEQYFGILYSNDMRPVELRLGNDLAEYPVVQATLTERYTERALEFIDAHTDQPFFLYLAHAMPHKPLACGERYAGRSGAGLYGDVIGELDDRTGQILDRLAERKLANRTLVILTSDNGPWYGGSTAGLRGMKGTSWEGGFRVPCLARWPGQLPAGRVDEQLAVTMDLFTTVLAAAGVAPPADRTLDGLNLLPSLERGTPRADRLIFGQQGPRLATVRDQRWKLHLAAQDSWKRPDPARERPDPRGPDGTTILAPAEQATRDQYPGLTAGDATEVGSLFDLEADPGEQHDVAAEHADVVARLRQAFDQAMADWAGLKARQ